jgi:hypothetical protein
MRPTGRVIWLAIVSGLMFVVSLGGAMGAAIGRGTLWPLLLVASLAAVSAAAYVRLSEE